jgi:hypothetical protein
MFWYTILKLLHMKTLFITISIVLLSGAFIESKGSDRNATREEQYQKTVDLIKGGDFIFEARRAFPQSGPSVDLTTNYGYIKMEDKKAQAHLPFFGRAYRAPYGGGGGIRFSSEITNVRISEDPGRLRISYIFDVRDQDFYQVTMNIGYNGDTSVNISSNNRSQIRYQGHVSPGK